MGLEITTSNPIFYLISPPEKASKNRKIGKSENRKARGCPKAAWTRGPRKSLEKSENRKIGKSKSLRLPKSSVDSRTRKNPEKASAHRKLEKLVAPQKKLGDPSKKVIRIFLRGRLCLA